MNDIVTGDRVVCINATPMPNTHFGIGKYFNDWLVEGDRYTVREIFDNPEGIPPSVTLEEITNPVVFQPSLGYARESAYAITRFAKVPPVKAETFEFIESMLN